MKFFMGILVFMSLRLGSKRRCLALIESDFLVLRVGPLWVLGGAYIWSSQFCVLFCPITEGYLHLSRRRLWVCFRPFHVATRARPSFQSDLQEEVKNVFQAAMGKSRHANVFL